MNRRRERAERDGPEFLGRHMIPVLKGPKGQPYVIDHHHLVGWTRFQAQWHIWNQARFRIRATLHCEAAARVETGALLLPEET